MIILNNVVPMDNQTFPFVSCFASWVLALSKSKVTIEQLKKKHQNLYRVYMPITGSGLGALWNVNEPTLDTCYCADDENYLVWAMQYAGYEYEKVINDGTNQEQLKQAIKASIEDGQPVMAQALIGSSWSLITGYDDDMNTLYGWHQRDGGITKNTADGYLENGMFIKSNWYDTIQQIVICKGKIKRQKLSSNEIITHFVSVLENKSVGDCIVGIPAFQKCIELLSDAALYKKIDDAELLRYYKAVFYFCASFAEARAFAGSTIETSEFKKKINADDRVKCLLNQASTCLRSSHKIVWDIWATLGKDYNYEPDKNVDRLRDENVRNRVIELVTSLKDNDTAALKYFKECLQGEV